MTFEYWFKYETNLPYSKRSVALLAWQASRQQALTECLDIIRDIDNREWFKNQSLMAQAISAAILERKEKP